MDIKSLAADIDKHMQEEISEQIAVELRLIGRYHNVESILSAWLAERNLYLVAGGGWNVVHSVEGSNDLIGHCPTYEQALAVALEQVDGDIAALKQGQS